MGTCEVHQLRRIRLLFSERIIGCLLKVTSQVIYSYTKHAQNMNFTIKNYFYHDLSYDCLSLMYF